MQHSEALFTSVVQPYPYSTLCERALGAPHQPLASVRLKTLEDGISPLMERLFFLTW